MKRIWLKFSFKTQSVDSRFWGVAVFNSLVFSQVSGAAVFITWRPWLVYAFLVDMSWFVGFAGLFQRRELVFVGFVHVGLVFWNFGQARVGFQLSLLVCNFCFFRDLCMCLYWPAQPAFLHCLHSVSGNLNEPVRPHNRHKASYHTRIVSEVSIVISEA